ncbi:hypothetical protein Ct9H90mP29_01500 [bacterium]|nr:MAG: hypothetical protein Ct9H90mP29_01500 [bacterium]
MGPPDLIDNVWQNLGEDVDGDGVVSNLLIMNGYLIQMMRMG